VFGDNPAEGVVRGRGFLHAGLRFRLTFPEGWDVTNAKTQVVAQRPDGDALVVLQPVEAPSGSLETVARSQMQNAGFVPVDGGLADLNGLRAYVGTYRGQSAEGTPLMVRAAHIDHAGHVYLLAGVAPERVYAGVEPAFSGTIRSFEPMTAAEAAVLRPNRIALTFVRGGDTWASIAARAGEGLVKASTLAIMNHSPADRPPRPGERIKVVVTG
jgi:predicted Zn-dependent protease